MLINILHYVRIRLCYWRRQNNLNLEVIGFDWR